MAIPLIAIAALAQMAMGAAQKASANKALRKMGEYPSYQIDPLVNDMIVQMRERTKYGLDPTQRASLENDIARGEATSFSRGVSVSGNQGAGYMQSALNAINLPARMRIGAMDVQAKDQHLREFGPWLQYKQSLVDKQTANSIQNYIRKAQSFGAAGKEGNSNMMNGMMTGIMSFGGGKGGGLPGMGGGGGGESNTGQYQAAANVNTQTPFWNANMGRIETPQVQSGSFAEANPITYTPEDYGYNRFGVRRNPYSSYNY